MKLYTVMPMHIDHVDEQVKDIENQLDTGVATDAIFIFTMVPEGAPPIDKAGLLSSKFDLYRDKLRADGYDCGVLVQATIGHGYALNQMFPFQPKIGLADGLEYTVCCPYDENFRTFMRSQFRTIASHHPKEIMVDDDMRLMHRVERGCACPLHMAEVNRRAGTHLTREELWDRVRGDSAEDKRIRDIFVETQKESVMGAARAYRQGIDDIDPTIPGSFCGAGEALEFGAELAQILRGEGNPVVLRLNNSNYHAPAGARGFTDSMYKAARQAAVVNGRADILLAETDTCPQNRYSTSAYQVHAHLAGSILEGVDGAKHWITRIPTYEPDSGKAYRRVLGKYRGYYETLSSVAHTVSWRGARVPVSHVPDYEFKRGPMEIWTIANNGWSNCVYERLGLPLFFGADMGGVALLEGNMDELFTDAELREMLTGTVFIASDAAKRLCDRGLGEYLGVSVRPWTGKNPTGELIDGKTAGRPQKNLMELVPVSDDVRWDSTVYHLHDGKEIQTLFPGVAVFKNDIGGTAVTFCGTPMAAYHYTEGFSFLCEARKKQLARLMAESGQLPVWYPGDEEVYFRAGFLPDGDRFCAVFNIGLDPIEEIVLRTEQPVTSIRRLTPDGRWEDVPFTEADGAYTLPIPAVLLDPVMLILR